MLIEKEKPKVFTIDSMYRNINVFTLYRPLNRSIEGSNK